MGGQRNPGSILMVNRVQMSLGRSECTSNDETEALPSAAAVHKLEGDGRGCWQHKHYYSSVLTLFFISNMRSLGFGRKESSTFS